MLLRSDGAVLVSDQAPGLLLNRLDLEHRLKAFPASFFFVESASDDDGFRQRVRPHFRHTAVGGGSATNSPFLYSL